MIKNAVLRSGMFVCLLIFGAVVIAADPILVLGPDGPMLLRRTNGAIELVPYPYTWVDMTGGTKPPPPDTDPNDDGDVDGDTTSPGIALTRQVQQWAAAVNDPGSAQALALVYRQVVEAINAGQLTIDTGTIALRGASDAVLMARAADAKWDPFRASVSQTLAERRQHSAISTPAHLASFLVAVAHGLELAADGSEAIDFNTVIGIAHRVNQEITKAQR